MKEKRVKYEVYAEGESHHFTFYKYQRMLDFLWAYIPRWIHKMKVYKIQDGNTYLGKFVQNNRYPIKF